MSLIPDKEEARVLIAFVSLGMAFTIILVPIPFPSFAAKQWMVYAFLSTTGSMVLAEAVSGRRS